MVKRITLVMDFIKFSINLFYMQFLIKILEKICKVNKFEFSNRKGCFRRVGGS
jgi:hypothetical protein